MILAYTNEMADNEANDQTSDEVRPKEARENHDAREWEV
jgi:hypothetical protein